MRRSLRLDFPSLLRYRQRRTTGSRLLVISVIAFAAGMTAIHGPAPAVAFPYSTYLWVWGANHFGELGDHADVDSARPLLNFAFPMGTLITALAAGDGSPLAGSQSLARDWNKNAWGWGYNSSGQVGDGKGGALANAFAPVEVCAPGQAAPCAQFLSGITSIAAGGFHSLALDSGGTVWAWGYNFYGQLGTGGQVSTVPVQVCLALEPIATAAATTATASAIPVLPCFPPGATATAIAAGGFHSLALDATGVIWAWGTNGQGQLGNNGPGGSRLSTVFFGQGEFNPTVTAIAAGGDHSLALDRGGSVWAWGANDAGQLGTGSFAASSNIPTRLTFFPPGTTLTAIAAGSRHSLALDSAGNVWAWGANEHGQLGNQQRGIDSHGPARTLFPAGTRIVTIAAGGIHSLALDSHHNLWAWGNNGHGQLGNGQTGIDSDVPVQIIFPAGTRLVGIAAGTAHSLALESRSFLDGIEAVLEFDALLAQARLVPQSLNFVPLAPTFTATALDRGGHKLLVTYTLTDTAGNRLVLTLIQQQHDPHSLTIRMQSVQYNGGAVTTLPTNQLEYRWDTDARGTITRLDQRLTLGRGDGKTDITAHYKAGKNQTTIDVDPPEPQKKQHLTEAGMVILKTSTVNGQLAFSDGRQTWPQPGLLVESPPKALDD